MATNSLLPVRRIFLHAVGCVRDLLDEPALAERWDRPSALEEFSVAGLAGHLLRATSTVETYLDGEEPAPAPLASAPEYYAGLLDQLAGGVDAPLNRSVRERGLAEAGTGPADLSGRWDATAARLAGRLGEVGPDRRVAVLGGTVMGLDDYLVTRIVELCVHGDDLAVSLDVAPPPFASEATGVCIAALVGVARLRHGDGAVLRALTRRERDVASALRIF